MSRIKSRRTTALLLTFLLAFPFAAAAQQKRNAPARRGRAKQEAPAPPAKSKQQSVVIPDLVTGQKIIEATADYNTTLKVGLAPGAVVLVEFPALDSILRVHPGDQNLVTVDDTDTAPNYPLIFRPGDGFVVTKGGTQPFALITVQMASGIPFVFQVYPVANIEDSASRVVIRYDRDKVVAARRAAGLPVNYKPVPLRPGVYAPEETITQAASAAAAPARLDVAAREETASVVSVPAPTPAPTPVIIARPAPVPAATPAAFVATSSPVITTDTLLSSPAFSNSPARRVDVPRNIPVSTPSTSRPVSNAPGGPAARPAGGAGRVMPSPSQPAVSPRPLPVTALNGSLRDYMREVVGDAKAFSKYSKALYGLSVAVSRPRDVNIETRLIVIAVKNTLTESVRLVPGQPDLFVETLDDKRSPVLVEPIQKLGLETTAPLGDLLAPGATAYYAVAFTPPILGTHQYLRISVAQTTAADSPSSVDLTIKSR